jgi:galactosamine-6-phosphate isomerase
VKIIEQPDYEAMSQLAAAHFRDVVLKKPNALICFATGSSPRRMYEILADDPLIRRSTVRALALDEWHGIPAQHPATCRYFLEQNVFNPWGIPVSRRYVFNAAAEDPDGECRRMAAVLEQEGPVDLCVLGLGCNGHLGLNEPADSLHAHAHTARLDEKSQKHSMLADEGVRVTRGMTFGMADLLQSKEILMLVSGKNKREISGRFLNGGITTRLPASFLRLHARVNVFLDVSVI